jgi:hypothetical protein
MIDGGVLMVSTIVVASTGAATTALNGVFGQATEPIDLPTIFTQVGVFGVVIAVAYYFLRRSDTREEKISSSSRAELKVVKDDNSCLRAELHEKGEKLTDSLAETKELLRLQIQLEARVAHLQAELDAFRGH